MVQPWLFQNTQDPQTATSSPPLTSSGVCCPSVDGIRYNVHPKLRWLDEKFRALYTNEEVCLISYLLQRTPLPVTLTVWTLVRVNGRESRTEQRLS